jgi:hypothetical protein
LILSRETGCGYPACDIQVCAIRLRRFGVRFDVSIVGVAGRIVRISIAALRIDNMKPPLLRGRDHGLLATTFPCVDSMPPQCHPTKAPRERMPLTS